MVRRILWLSAIVVLAVGCAVPVKKPAGWVRADLKPVTQPQLVSGRLLLFVAAGGGLQLLALDPKTGKTVWHASASPGDVTLGEAPGFNVVGSIVIFLSPVNSADTRIGGAQMVGADALTGQLLWRTSALLFTSPPGSCPGNADDICTTITVFQPPQTWFARYTAVTDPTPGMVMVSHAAGGRAIGPDLIDPGSRDPETLMAVNGAAKAWARTLASVFPSPGASTSYGFTFARIPAAGLFVGSVGVKPVGAFPKLPAVYDPSKYMTAGFRISDGTVAWRDPGTEYACTVPLPCPAADGPGYQPPAEGLRLRLTGTVTVTGKLPPAPKLSPGGNVVVEGFNLVTGKTLWSYDAGADASLASFQAPPLLGADVAALPAPGGGMTAVNLATGARRPISPATPAWCESPVTYRAQPEFSVGGGVTSDIHAGQNAFEPCQASGHSAPVPPAVPGFVGAVADGFTVWSEPSAVVAAPTNP
jgi:hypothetical protein